MGTANAKEKVARAELEYSYTGKPGDQTKVLVAKAKSAYAVAKEKFVTQVVQPGACQGQPSAHRPITNVSFLTGV